MVNRLMDLVVLVVELTQKRDKSFKELDKELVHMGYSSEEIEQAFFWVSSQWHRADHIASPSLNSTAIRVLSPWEFMCLDTDAYNYLLRLKNLGILNEDQFERIMYRVLSYRGEALQISDIKGLAGAVIFELGADDFDGDLLHVLDDGIQVT